LKDKNHSKFNHFYSIGSKITKQQTGAVSCQKLLNNTKSGVEAPQFKKVMTFSYPNKQTNTYLTIY
jgi:hypothetical protein